MNRLMTLLEDHELFHSEFQIRNLIVARAGGTIYGAYKQAIRELWNRLNGIGTEIIKFGLMQKPTTQRQEQKTIYPQPQELLAFFEQTPILKDTLRETVILYYLAGWLKSRLGELNDQSKQRLEEELWIHKVKCAIAVDFLSIGRLSAPTVELLHALPIEMRGSIIEILRCPESHEFLIEWYLTDSLDFPILDTANRDAISGELIANICESTNWCKLSEEDLSMNSLTPTIF